MLKFFPSCYELLIMRAFKLSPFLIDKRITVINIGKTVVLNENKSLLCHQFLYVIQSVSWFLGALH